MAARIWTPEQRQRQAEAIRGWKPWEQSTGPMTAKGKQVSSKNAVNYSCREVLREMARQNRALINFISGHTPAPKWDRTAIDGLLDELEKTLDNSTTKPDAATSTQPVNVSKQSATMVDERDNRHCETPHHEGILKRTPCKASSR